MQVVVVGEEKRVLQREKELILKYLLRCCECLLYKAVNTIWTLECGVPTSIRVNCWVNNRLIVVAIVNTKCPQEYQIPN